MVNRNGPVRPHPTHLCLQSRHSTVCFIVVLFGPPSDSLSPAAFCSALLRPLLRNSRLVGSRHLVRHRIAGRFHTHSHIHTFTRARARTHTHTHTHTQHTTQHNIHTHTHTTQHTTHTHTTHTRTHTHTHTHTTRSCGGG